MIDLEWIRRLLEMVEESDIDSLEVSRYGTRVRVSKSPPGGGVHVMAAEGAAQVPRPAAELAGPSAPGPDDAAGPAENADREPAPDLHEVTSPMVGTFYRSPAPDAPPYVEVGDRVGKGQTLCILEAMKLMNELEAEVTGTIAAIAVENADPVEYGQVLFRIDTGGAG